jgi:hypothetical protein
VRRFAAFLVDPARPDPHKSRLLKACAWPELYFENERPKLLQLFKDAR